MTRRDFGRRSPARPFESDYSCDVPAPARSRHRRMRPRGATPGSGCYGSSGCRSAPTPGGDRLRCGRSNAARQSPSILPPRRVDVALNPVVDRRTVLRSNIDPRNLWRPCQGRRIPREADAAERWSRRAGTRGPASGPLAPRGVRVDHGSVYVITQVMLDWLSLTSSLVSEFVLDEPTD